MPDEEEVPQPAPSPATISVPPGKWLLTVAKGNGQEVASAEVEGPLTLVVRLANS